MIIKFFPKNLMCAFLILGTLVNSVVEDVCQFGLLAIHCWFSRADDGS